MIDLVWVAADLQSFLLSKNWRFCFIGGLSVQQWGEPRLTRDIDLSLLTGFGSETPFIRELLKKYPSRIEDAERFAETNRVLLLAGPQNIGIDISLAGLPFEEAVVSRSKEVEVLPGTMIRLCSAEDLIVLKAFAARPIDWQDIEGVVIRQGADRLDWKQIESDLQPLVDLKGQPETLTRLKTLRR